MAAMTRRLGFDQFSRDDADRCWKFWDTFPPLAAYGRALAQDDGTGNFVAQVGGDKTAAIADARVLRDLEDFCDAIINVAMDKGVPVKLGAARKAKLEAFLQRGAAISTAEDRRTFGNAMEPLQALIASTSKPDALRALERLKVATMNDAFSRAQLLADDADDAEKRAAAGPELIIEVGVADNKESFPSRAQRGAYNALRKDLANQCGLVLDAILDALREGRKTPVPGFPLPAAESREDLRDHILLEGLCVHTGATAKKCDIGFSFRSSWDTGHGLGVRLTPTGAEVGDGDTAVEPRP